MNTATVKRVQPNLIFPSTGEIIALGWYFRKSGASMDAHSRLILQLKQHVPDAISYFADLISDMLTSDWAITAVPSHREGRYDTGVQFLAEQISSNRGTDASHCLHRVETIPKLAHGGIRSEGIHLSTIKVALPELIQDNAVLLLDDIVTTGSSLRACKSLLLSAGASFVQPLALGRTSKHGLC